MASPFLENLKKSVEEGDFNSEAAKKIIEIDKLAETMKASAAEKSLNDRLEKAGVKIVTEEEAAAINPQYEKQMADIKKQDAVNQQVATLIEIKDMVKLSILDMLSFTKELEEKFTKEFEAKDPIFNDLYLQIQEVKNKFEPTLLDYIHKE